MFYFEFAGNFLFYGHTSISERDSHSLAAILSFTKSKIYLPIARKQSPAKVTLTQYW